MQKLWRSQLLLALAVSLVLALVPLGGPPPPWHPARLAPAALLAALAALLTAVGVAGVLMAQLADAVQARTLRQSHAQLQVAALALAAGAAGDGAPPAGGRAKR